MELVAASATLIPLQAALCVLLGTAGCNVYLRLMQQQVDAVSPDDEVPIWRAEDSTGPFRSLAIAAAAYR